MKGELFTAIQASVPQYGVIEGGLFDGWPFAYVATVVRDGKFYLHLRCSPTKWPFPRTVSFGRGDYLSLKGGPGATFESLEKLINAATAATTTKTTK